MVFPEGPWGMPDERCLPGVGRELWIDVAKGIGIIAVVAIHVMGGGTRILGMKLEIALIFHMPLFFFLSGLLLKPDSDLKRFLIKKSLHLLVPYFVFFFLFNSGEIVTAVQKWIAFPGTGHWASNAMRVVRRLYGGATLSGTFGAFWFVTCLFFTQQLFNFLLTRFSKRVVIFLLCFSYGFAIFDSLIPPHMNSPLAINIVFMALPLMGAGYLGGRGIMRYPWGQAVLILFFILGIWLAPKFHMTLIHNMKGTGYGTPIIAFWGAMGGITMVMVLSRLISRIPFLRTLLALLGASSMLIMFTHQFLQGWLKGADCEMCHGGGMRVMLALLIPSVAYLVIKRAGVLSFIFLGSHQDWRIKHAFNNN